MNCANSATHMGIELFETKNYLTMRIMNVFTGAYADEKEI